MPTAGAEAGLVDSPGHWREPKTVSVLRSQIPHIGSPRSKAGFLLGQQTGSVPGGGVASPRVLGGRGRGAQIRFSS